MADIVSSVPSHAFVRVINPLLRWILESPLHGLFSSYLMVLAFRGRKSGTMYRTPISYHRLDGVVTVFSGAPWPSNLRVHPEVEVVVQGRRQSGRMEIVDDPAAVAEALYRILQETSRLRFSFWFGFKITGAGVPPRDQIQSALAGRRMLRFIIS